LLEQEYGVLEWHPTQDPVDTLVQTILSQNTSDLNSGRAFRSLKKAFGSWEAVASAPVEQVARAIESGGLHRIKAARIQEILRDIERRQGRVSLDFLRPLSMPEAHDFLMGLPGVGHKTAACVLLFSLGKPALPVDTHVFRVARRLGLLEPGTGIEQAHSVLRERIAPAKVYQFHLHMIEHGRRVCHARRPRCGECVLRPGCPASTQWYGSD